jgi:N,N-dimethylformamidase
MQVVEELYFNVLSMVGVENLRVRKDRVYYPTPNGGAVFLMSSIAYFGKLTHNNYDNNISQLTYNVLQKLMSDEPLQWEEQSLQISGNKNTTHSNKDVLLK